MSFDEFYRIVMGAIALLEGGDIAERASRVVPHHRRAYVFAHLNRLSPEDRNDVDRLLEMKLAGVV